MNIAKQYTFLALLIGIVIFRLFLIKSFLEQRTQTHSCSNTRSKGHGWAQLLTISNSWSLKWDDLFLLIILSISFSLKTEQYLQQLSTNLHGIWFHLNNLSESQRFYHKKKENQLF